MAAEVVDNAAQRRMCAACYVDAEFRMRALREVFADRSRRVAPSYGFDLVPVLAHAWRAWRRETILQVIVVALVVAAVVVAPTSAALVVSLLLLWYIFRGFVGVGVDIVRYLRRQLSAVEADRLRIRAKLLSYSLVGTLLLGAAVVLELVFSGDIWADFNGSWPTRGGVLPATTLLLLLVVISSLFSVLNRLSVSGLTAARYEPVVKRRGRYRTIQAQQNHPFTVYDGYEPFVGSGAAVRTWSFAQRLVREKEMGIGRDREFRTPPFTTEELVQRMRKRIERLATESSLETRLPGLSVRDNVFVQGFHSGPFGDVLRAEGDDEAIGRRVSEIMANPSDPDPTQRHDVARHYLACQVVTWGGEVVTTVFVHVSLQGRTLYIEFSTYALLPTREEYRLMDEVGGTGVSAIVRQAGKDLLNLPARLRPSGLVRAPAVIASALLASRDGTAKPRRNVNIGAKFSLREAAAASYEGNFFQYRDVFKYSKIIERRLLGTVGDYLKKRGVDTAEFWQRANGILNQGVIISGGRDVTLTDSAVGHGAQVAVAVADPVKQ